MPFRTLVDSLPISRYEVADLNEKSLQLFERQGREVPSVSTTAHRVNLLTDTPSLALADVVFSVGLIEHFTPQGTRIRRPASLLVCERRRRRDHYRSHPDVALPHDTLRGGANRRVAISRRATAAPGRDIAGWQGPRNTAAFPDAVAARADLAGHGLASA